MGVVGAGKTTIGTRLAQKLGWEFADADSFHSPENIEKISRGIPLTDSDRAPWLTAMRQAIELRMTHGQSVVLACSALKRSYRDELRAGGVQFVYLKGSPQLIFARLRSRQGHFADQKILESQIATLEEPDNDEPDAITLGVDETPEAIVAKIIAKLKLPS